MFTQFAFVLCYILFKNLKLFSTRHKNRRNQEGANTFSQHSIFHIKLSQMVARNIECMNVISVFD